MIDDGDHERNNAQDQFERTEDHASPRANASRSRCKHPLSSEQFHRLEEWGSDRRAGHRAADGSLALAQRHSEGLAEGQRGLVEIAARPGHRFESFNGQAKQRVGRGVVANALVKRSLVVRNVLQEEENSPSRESPPTSRPVLGRDGATFREQTPRRTARTTTERRGHSDATRSTTDRPTVWPASMNSSSERARMYSPLMCVNFFTSKKAGECATSANANCATSVLEGHDLLVSAGTSSRAAPK